MSIIGLTHKIGLCHILCYIMSKPRTKQLNKKSKTLASIGDFGKSVNKF